MINQDAGPDGSHDTRATARRSQPSGGMETVRGSVDDQGRAILTAAGQLLAEEGPTALTVRRIAASAGCSTMGLYSRFGGKEGVVDELFADGFRQLHAAMSQLVDTDDPVADLRACARAYRALALEHHTRYMVMFGGGVPGFEPAPQSRELAMASFDRLVARVTRCVDSGAFHGCPRHIARVFWSSLHGHVMLELVGLCPQVTEDPAGRFEQVVDVAFAGFAAGVLPAEADEPLLEPPLDEVPEAV